MAEAFEAFGESFRAYFTGLLALSTTAMFSSALLYAGSTFPTNWMTISFIVCELFFAITIGIVIFAAFIGMSKERNEGRDSSSDQRKINDEKYGVVRISVFTIYPGLVAFASFLASIALKTICL